MGIVVLLAVGAGLIIASGTLALCYGLTHPPRRTLAHALARGLPGDPSELNLNAEEVWFPLHGGGRSPAWIIEGADPDGPAVVMTHGWSSSRTAGLTRAAMLAPLASKIVLYDMRGHGESEAPRCHVGTTEADDLIGIIAHLDDAPSVLLYGSSMGAGVSIVAAARSAPGSIAGVIGAGIYRHPMEPVIGHLRCLRYPPFPFVWLGWPVLRAVYKGLAGFDRAAHASRLDCPLLLLHGTEDAISPIDSARTIRDAAPDAALVPFEGAPHGGLHDWDPKRYLDAIDSFVRRRPIPGAEPVPEPAPSPVAQVAT